MPPPTRWNQSSPRYWGLTATRKPTVRRTSPWPVAHKTEQPSRRVPALSTREQCATGRFGRHRDGGLGRDAPFSSLISAQLVSSPSRKRLGATGTAVEKTLQVAPLPPKAAVTDAAKSGSFIYVSA